MSEVTALLSTSNKGHGSEPVRRACQPPVSTLGICIDPLSAPVGVSLLSPRPGRGDIVKLVASYRCQASAEGRDDHSWGHK